MLEFIFFHQAPLKSFLDQLKSRELTYTTRLNEKDGEYEAHIDEDIADDILSEVEDIYDQLMEQSQQEMDEESDENSENYSLSSITITLSDGTITYAKVPAGLLSKIVEVISAQELGEIVNAIADAVENPDSRSMCQRIREQDMDK